MTKYNFLLDKINFLNKKCKTNWNIRFHDKLVDINYPDSPVTPDYEDYNTIDEALDELIADLLATLSPEEESQKIMMEQVPKEKLKYNPMGDYNPVKEFNKVIDNMYPEGSRPKSSKEKEFIPQNGEEFWFKKKSPTPSTNIKEIEPLKLKDNQYTVNERLTLIEDKLNEIIINSLNTIIKKI